MIKINLLPRIVDERAAVRNTAIIFGVVLIAILVGAFTFTSRLKASVEDMERQAADAEAWKARVEQIQQQAAAIKNETAPMKRKVDFVTKVLEYNTRFPELYREIARWTYEKVKLNSLQCDGAQVQMQIQVKTIDDLARYLFNMYRATHLFSSVTISALPGYPRQAAGLQVGAAVPLYEESSEMQASSLAGIGAIAAGMRRTPGTDQFDITVNCVLKNPITAPVFEGAAPAGQQQPGGPQTMPTPGPTPGPPAGSEAGPGPGAEQM